MTDLELATTTEIVAELAKRHEGVLLCTVTTKRVGTAAVIGMDATECHFRGSRVTAIGLADIARRKLLDSYSEQMEIERPTKEH